MDDSRYELVSFIDLYLLIIKRRDYSALVVGLVKFHRVASRYLGHALKCRSHSATLTSPHQHSTASLWERSGAVAQWRCGKEQCHSTSGFWSCCGRNCRLDSSEK